MKIDLKRLAALLTVVGLILTFVGIVLLVQSGTGNQLPEAEEEPRAQRVPVEKNDEQVDED